jgi:hypothetical protein
MSTWQRWRPAAIVVGGTLLLIGGIMLLVGNPAVVEQPETGVAPTATPTAATAATTEEPVLPQVDASVAADGDISDVKIYFITLPDGFQIPLPPGVTDAQILPEPDAELAQTPEWKRDKIIRIHTVVTDRVGRVEKEIADLEKQGKKDQAAEKKILLGRLQKQLADMKTEIKGYEDQITGDGGTLSGGAFGADAK